MWNFNPFSIPENSQELEASKVLLDNWFQNLKIKETRWRVPHNIERILSLTAHIQLELDHIVVRFMQGTIGKSKPLNYYP